MSRDAKAALLSAGLGVVIWALSKPVTGRVEPWDANSAYYYVALALAGLAAGLAMPTARMRAHYLGAVAGQALYGLVMLKGSGLFILGVGFLFVYSLLYLAGVAGGVRLRRKGESDA